MPMEPFFGFQLSYFPNAGDILLNSSFHKPKKAHRKGYNMLRYLSSAFWLTWVLVNIALFHLVLLICLPLSRISPPHFRQITEFAGTHLWVTLIYILQHLGHYNITLYGDDPSQNESAIVLLNHQYWCDFVCAFFVAHHKNKLGMVKGFAKDLILYIPVVGTALHGMGFVFLTRNWDIDKVVINESFRLLKESGSYFWLFTHPEGNRITREKVRDGHLFSESRGLPKLDHVLLPRVKGFVATLEAIDKNIGAIYDLTVAYSKPPGGILTIAAGNPFGPKHYANIDICIRRFPISEIPSEEKARSMWLYKIYEEKDKILGYWKENHKFPPEMKLIPLDRAKEVTLTLTISHYLKWFGMSALPVLLLCYGVYRVICVKM